MTAPGTVSPAGDPSMEDILASIRRILADGEEGDAGEPHAPRIAPPAAADDVFVLDQTMLIEEPAPMRPESELPPAPLSEAPHDYSHLDAGEIPPAPLLAPDAAAAAGASLGALARAVGARQTQIYRNGPTLEDMVRDEIRPLVKEWLDENLPALVERMVRAEIERVTSQTR